MDIIEPYHPEMCYDNLVGFKFYLLHRSRHPLLEDGTMRCSICYHTPVLITYGRGIVACTIERGKERASDVCMGGVGRVH